MNQPFNNNDVERLYREVIRYDQNGDVYNAIKLCKRIVKLAPDWSAPYAYLGRLYKQRKEWKPAFHYCLKAVEQYPFDDELWSTLALSATALEDWQQARQAWNHLGYHFRKGNEELCLNLGRLAICINPDCHPEIVEATRIDPARAVIESIPQPSSGKRYKDLLLIDTQPAGTHYKGHKASPFYNELEHLKHSPWQTFGAFLHTSSLRDVDALSSLCEDEGLGFDNWSHASRFLKSDLHPMINEYFDLSYGREAVRDIYLVSIAATQFRSVKTVLREWAVITLKRYSALEKLS